MSGLPAGQPSDICCDLSAEQEQQKAPCGCKEQRNRMSEFVREAGAAGGVALQRDERLACHTTFRIGGPADLLAYANTQAQLESLMGIACSYGIPTTILGGGSNVLVSDAGVRGLVIANRTREFAISPAYSAGPMARRTLPGCDAELVADSGVMLAGLARRSIREGWSGLEWAVSVPGTVGGAIIGNAGAQGGQIADNLLWVLASFPGEGRRVVAAEELALSYRGSAWKRCLSAGEAIPAVLAAAFGLKRGDAHVMATRAETYLAQRRASQPGEPSAGSVFRNPPGDHAGRLIDAAGLKGYRVGGAAISARHANFIVNPDRTATAADVLQLMNIMRERVYESAGIALEAEILFIGTWPSQPPFMHSALSCAGLGRPQLSATS